MNHSTSKIAALTFGSIFCLTIVLTPAHGQAAITDLGLQNLLDFSFDVTITFDDNSTATITLQAEDETSITAPSGKEITKLTAGTKTVGLPMSPSTQTGWNIPGTPQGQTVTAFFEQKSDVWAQHTGYSHRVSFSY